VLERDAQRRVVQRLIVEAARLEQQRIRRVWLGSAASVALLAAAAVLLYMRAPQPQPAAAPVADNAVAAPEPACALPVLPHDQFLGEDSGSSVALGALGELVTQPNSRVSVESSGPCELALRLHSGTLAGDLHSLRPARLLIRTDQGEVSVTGTRFSVHSDAELEVLLETGVVDVQLSDGEKVRLQPRTRLHKVAGKRAVDRQGLSAADEKRLASWLAPPPKAAVEAPVVQPETTHKSATFESSSAALTAAGAALRSGRWSAAREAYQFASQGKDINAEVALLGWARLEMEQLAPASALRLVTEHKRRFGRGGRAGLGAEAGFIEVQARKALGQGERAEQAARRLVERYPGTPQATAASKMLLEAE
jgi:hypothetical protein